MKTLGIIGCGNLGLALLKGARKQFPTLPMIGSRRSIDSLLPLQDNLTSFTTNNQQLIEQSDVIILALKPYMVQDFLKEFGTFLTEKHTLISVVTGVTIADMETAIGHTKNTIFRGMPNTAADVLESMTALCGKKNGYSEVQKSGVNELFESMGQTVWIDEQLMESATILGACGIAYVLRFIRAMIQGGIEVGFDAKTANKIVAQTVKGAAQLLIENGRHPEEEIDKVTTPKGVTIVGLNEMEHSGFSSALIKGIVTSYSKIEKK